MWGYNTNMGQFGGPMTPRMNMGGGPRGFNPWMQGIPNGFTPPNFANNMGEVFGGMPGGQGPNPDPIRTSLPYYYPSGTGSSGGGPMQFNMGSQPGKMPGNPMPNMPQLPPGGMQPGRRDMNAPNPGVFIRNSNMPSNPNPWTMHGFGVGKFLGSGGQGGEDVEPYVYEPLPYKVPQGGGNQPRPMEIPPQIAQQLFGYQKPVNDIYQESPGKSTRSKGDTGWLNSMLTENPYLRPMRVGNSGMGGMPMGGFNPRMMGGGMGSSQLFPQQQFDPRLLAMPSIKGQDTWNGGGMGLGMGMSNGLLGPGPSTPGVDVNSPQAKAGQQAMLSYLQSRFTPDQLSRMMMQGGGRGTGVPNPLGYSSLVSPQQAQQLMGMFGGGGMGNPNAPYSTNPNHMVYM